jgi:predicted aconitase with swiveling domain
MHISSCHWQVDVTMAEITLKGHPVVKGKAAGEAIVTHDSISFMGSIDPKTGIITESGAELQGQKISGKILVFPSGKGSTGGSYMLYEMAKRGTGPKGIINLRTDSVVAIGAVIGNITTVDQLEKNPLEIIQSGDHVTVDGDTGIVTIKKATSG